MSTNGLFREAPNTILKYCKKMLHRFIFLLPHTCKDISHLRSGTNLAYTVYRSTAPAIHNFCSFYERRHFGLPTLRNIILGASVLFFVTEHYSST